jgi:hypothetical protein
LMCCSFAYVYRSGIVFSSLDNLPQKLFLKMALFIMKMTKIGLEENHNI